MEIPLWPLAGWQLLKSSAGWSVWAHDGQVLPEMQSWHCTHQLHTNDKKNPEQLYQCAVWHSFTGVWYIFQFDFAGSNSNTLKGRQILNDHAILKRKTEKKIEINFYLKLVTQKLFHGILIFSMLYYIL